MKIAFLVLHYKNYSVTDQCLQAVFNNLTCQNFDVVVVDNASNDGSYELLEEKYGHNSRVYLLHNNENIGYAKGNNIGFRFAKKQLKADMIILINNDIIINQKDFLEKVEEAYDRYGFFVCGPDIVTPKEVHQNPFRLNVASKRQIESRINHDRIVYCLHKLRVQRILRKMIGKKTEWIEHYKAENIEDFQGVLHGSCLIFSPKYVAEFNGMYEGTFLYVEEEILCFILNKLKYKYTYLNDVQVIHKHGTTLKTEEKDENKRKMRTLKYRIESYKRFVEIINDKRDLKRYLM